ncbi:SgcJ/EcaC family oxidoreductase [Thermobifida halotolerans]|uniref:SgcJ/EcaC family oxidoreductase n=1 Tax=Thermobifida halotolerans TaxID=483545 RepID=A0A399G6F9_9ACTN|nr:SgcJ/EcaC family oxidoreductase [Thermobifida halotolerans]UOE21174.1 SgcJ/EcaC family oxidoreductase [Thermobifida halotolerans]
MNSDEEIRALVSRWAAAVHDGDLDGVLADHAEDIVMFDVPPPHEGVRGLDAYARTWPPFFDWQARGAVFEVESLDVTAGDDVAFAHALLRCGTPERFADAPDERLRLTLGLRRRDGRWVVAHEHHSFADTGADRDDTAAEEEVRALHRRWFADTAAKNLDGLMAAIADDVVSYEHDQPLRHLGAAAVRRVCARGLDEAGAGEVSWTVPDLRVLVRDDLAVAWGLNRVRTERADGGAAETWSRGTRVFERRGGAWVMVHQHLSYPYDPDTGEARTDLRP